MSYGRRPPSRLFWLALGAGGATLGGSYIYTKMRIQAFKDRMQEWREKWISNGGAAAAKIDSAYGKLKDRVEAVRARNGSIAEGAVVVTKTSEGPGSAAEEPKITTHKINVSVGPKVLDATDTVLDNTYRGLKKLVEQRSTTNGTDGTAETSSSEEARDETTTATKPSRLSRWIRRHREEGKGDKDEK